MYIDAHCHLDLLSKESGVDLSKEIEKAREKGVKKILTNGVNFENNNEVLKIADNYEEVEACFGIYPTDAVNIIVEELDELFDFISLEKDNILGIGEIGLDFKETIEEEDQLKQITVFERILELAKKLDKPIFVHSRKAEKECIEMIEKSGIKKDKVVMHCFSGKKALVKRIIDNGWFMTIPTAVKNSEHFQMVVKDCPITQLLCETDSPFLHPDKEFPNSPVNVIESYKKIAEIKKISLKEAEERIEDNFVRLIS